jgi:hypothetical protein
MSRTLLAVVVLVVAIAPIARAEEIPPGGVSSVPSTPVVGGPAPPEPLSPAPPLRNYADAFAVGDAFTDLGSDRARKIVNEAMSDVKAQASKLPKGAGAAGRSRGPGRGQEIHRGQ